MRLAKITPLAAVALLIGCADQPLPTELTKGPLFNSSGPVVQSVTGSGHTTRPATDIWRTFSINARKYPDRTVEGQFQVNNHGGTNFHHGIVTCMTFYGNRAWLGVYFTKSTNPSAEDTEGILRVVDNGEGKNADPDQISYIAFGNVDAAAFCDATPDFPLLHDVESGNIQVRE